MLFENLLHNLMTNPVSFSVLSSVLTIGIVCFFVSYQKGWFNAWAFVLSLAIIALLLFAPLEKILLIERDNYETTGAPEFFGLIVCAIVVTRAIRRSYMSNHQLQ